MIFKTLFIELIKNFLANKKMSPSVTAKLPERYKVICSKIKGLPKKYFVIFSCVFLVTLNASSIAEMLPEKWQDKFIYLAHLVEGILLQSIAIFF